MPGATEFRDSSRFRCLRALLSGRRHTANGANHLPGDRLVRAGLILLGIEIGCGAALDRIRGSAASSWCWPAWFGHHGKGPVDNPTMGPLRLTLAQYGMSAIYCLHCPRGAMANYLRKFPSHRLMLTPA